MSEEIQLGPDIFVQCPLIGFAHRTVKACLACGHYGGIARATVDGAPIDGSDADCFQIVCKKPITRRLMQVVME